MIFILLLYYVQLCSYFILLASYLYMLISTYEEMMTIHIFIFSPIIYVLYVFLWSPNTLGMNEWYFMCSMLVLTYYMSISHLKVN